MPKFGLLINYKLCTGCHTCEVACKQENEYPAGTYGIRVVQIGPEKARGKMVKYWFPFPTENCRLCPNRLRKGLKPSCVHHCQARCMTFGTIKELSEILEKRPHSLLYVR